MSRRWAARIAAPAAFLAGVTVAVLLVRAGLADEDEATTTAPFVSISVSSGTTRAKPKSKPFFATVKEGDTLDQIALEHDTTVERLLVLNPDLDPNSLQIGQRIRVR